ncbi:MAG TPA: tetratricopeptide repeat protein, partial [Armatimonadota bacterium]|nr:tetratricopeptide repeat protein [Armatimonadota bacterium]
MQCSRQWIVIWLFFACVLITYATEIPPQRLALLRGTIALAKGDESALPDLMQAALLAPEEWRIQMLYGEALAQSGEKTLAKGQFRRAALLAPWRPEPWQTIIDFAHANGDKQLEYAGLAGLMRIFPENVVLRSHLADLYRALGQLDAAKKLDASWQADLPPLTFTASYPLNGHTATLAELRDLTQQQPEKIEILAALATEEWRAGNGMGVYNALTKQLQLTPTDLPTIYNLAHICFMLKHVDEGIQVLCTAPVGDKFADQNIAAWLIANNHYADALPPLQRLLQQNPTDPVLNRQLGVISLLTGDTATAITALRTAWDNGSDDLTAQAYIIALLQAG